MLIFLELNIFFAVLLAYFLIKKFNLFTTASGISFVTAERLQILGFYFLVLQIATSLGQLHANLMHNFFSPAHLQTWLNLANIPVRLDFPIYILLLFIMYGILKLLIKFLLNKKYQLPMHGWLLPFALVFLSFYIGVFLLVLQNWQNWNGWQALLFLLVCQATSLLIVYIFYHARKSFLRKDKELAYSYSSTIALVWSLLILS